MRCLLLCVMLALVGCSPPSANHTPRPTPAQAPVVKQQRAQVIIIGGGLAGLCTAYHLKQAGIDYRILELAPRVGGRVRTGTYPEETRAEVGLAELWDGNPALDIARALKVPLEESELGVSSLVLQGKLEGQVGDKNNQAYIQRVLGPDYSAFQRWDRQMLQHLEALEKRPIPAELMALKDVSMEAWLGKSGLPPRAQALVRAVLEPEIGTTLGRISALDGIAEWHLFAGQGAMPHHVVGGNQVLTETLADHVGRERIDLNTQVTNVIDGPNGVEVRAVCTSDFSNQVYQGEVAVLTVPLFRLFEIQFEPRLHDDVYKAIHTQMWGAYFTAHVQLDKGAEKYWTEKGTSLLPILTGGPLGVIYAGESASSERVLVNLLVTGDSAEVYNSRTMSLDDVQQKLTEAFEKQFPGISPMIRKWTFYRYHPRAIAAWPVGRSRFDALSEKLRQPHGRLYFGGDFTESSHSDGAARSALRMSTQIRQRLQP